MAVEAVGVVAVAVAHALGRRRHHRDALADARGEAAAAIGMGYGLVAILVHSLTDFGQHIPANACLTALYGALLLNLAQAVKLGRGAPPRVGWSRLTAGARG